MPLLQDFRDQGAKRGRDGSVVARPGARARQRRALRCALFTNLTHDHLDYHGTMAAYGEAKARLFEMPGLAGRGAQPRRSVRRRARAAPAGRRAHHRLQPASRATRRVDSRRSCWDPSAAAFRRLGRFNVSNALGVLGCLVANGISFEEAQSCWRRCRPCPGACRRVGEEPLVVIDYAHTPDALENVLQALRPVAQRARRPARGGVRRRRRPRPDQAPADGRDRRAPRRPRAGHLGQPAQRGSAGDHRADRERLRRRARGRGRSRARDRADHSRRRAERRGADRRQGPRDLPGDRGQPLAVLRRRAGARGARAPERAR